MTLQARAQGEDAEDRALEQLYWSLVEQTCTDTHVVEYASDIDTGRFACTRTYSRITPRPACTNTFPPWCGTSPPAEARC